MPSKKDLPLAILKALEPYVNLKGDKFEVLDPKGKLLHVSDKDSNSSFHFIIEKYQRATNGNFQFFMSRSPKNVNDNGNYQAWVEVSGLRGQFDAWINLLDDYDSVSSFYDDPIAKSFTEEFYAEFEIIDEKADVTPLKTTEILQLDCYLENIGGKLGDYRTEKNSGDISEIQEDIQLLRENLTTKSKKWVASKVANIWAKIAKQGTKFIKEFLSEGKKEMAKQSVKGLIEYLKENGADLIN